MYLQCSDRVRLSQVPLSETECVEVEHHVTEGLLHRGQHMHGALPISSGTRWNLIIWMRASRERNKLCPMCGKRPTLVESNGFSDGFTMDPDDDTSRNVSCSLTWSCSVRMGAVFVLIYGPLLSRLAKLKFDFGPLCLFLNQYQRCKCFLFLSNFDCKWTNCECLILGWIVNKYIYTRDLRFTIKYDKQQQQKHSNVYGLYVQKH